MEHAVKKVFSEERKKNRFVTVVDLNKYLKQIEWQSSLLTCTPISELLFNISTMVKFFKEVQGNSYIKKTSYYVFYWEKQL